MYRHKQEIIELVETPLGENYMGEVFRDYPKGEITKDTKPIWAFFGKEKEQLVSIIDALDHGYSKKAVADYLGISAYVITKKLSEVKRHFA